MAWMSWIMNATITVHVALVALTEMLWYRAQIQHGHTLDTTKT